MMNTDVMRQLVAEAESGDKAMPTARTAASLWGYDDGTLSDFRYSANAIYTFQQQSTRRFMRLTWAADKPMAYIKAELDYLGYLEGKQFPAMQPILSNQGQWIEEISNPYARFYAVTFIAAQGASKDVDTLTSTETETWGALLGRLHLLSETFQPSTVHQHPSWTDVIKIYASWVPDSAGSVKRYLAEAKVWLTSLPMDQHSYGLIHGDFEPDNLSWHDTEIDVFDFDDAAYFWYAADIAFALDDVLKLPSSQARKIIQHFLKGYQGVRELGSNWIQSLPLFIRLMRAMKTARIYHAFAGTHAEFDPSWLAELRERLMNICRERQAEYGNTRHFQDPLSAAEFESWGVFFS